MNPSRFFRWFGKGEGSTETKLQLTQSTSLSEALNHLQVGKPEPIHILGVDELEEEYGIYKGDRIHTAVFGFPGTGKTTLLLSLILQHIKRNEGFMVIDPHGDLAKKVLTHIQREKWDRVVYIDPLTAFDEKCGMVVQVNFLEYKGWLDRDLVARVFMDSLSKIYTRFWGPRLDMILLNAVYLLLEGKRDSVPKLSDLYRVIADEWYREKMLANVDDEKVRTFWLNEYKRMPRDASSSVMTKIYRIVQERIIVPMFECDQSSVDFRLMMDQGLFVIVNLSEGAITSDLANFLGSLILARVYLAGMSREDTLEEERTPYYVYVDEAYRFVTASIKDILQSLRKYRVYLTLASQYLEQYREDVALSIPSLCDTIICFAVGKDTARRLEEFYLSTDWSYQHLMNLPKYWFAVSTMLRGRRECQALKCIDYGFGETRVEEVVKQSLLKYGRPVDISHITGQLAQAKGDLPTPELSPSEWLILLKLWLTKEERRGEGLNRDEVESENLLKTLEDEYDLTTLDTASALNLLSRRAYLKEHKQPRDWTGVRLPEINWTAQPVKCVKCGRDTHRPYWLRDGKNAMCRICAERSLAKKQRKPESFVGLKLEEVGEIYHRSRTFTYYSIHPTAEERFFKDAPRGQRGGGTLHAAMIGFLADRWRREGCFCIPDLGEDPGKKMPDVLVYPLYRKAGRLTVHPKLWDTPHRFAIEVEIEPSKHPDRVISNWEKCKAWGIPIILAIPTFEGSRKTLEALLSRGATVAADAPSEYGPGVTTVLFVRLESGTQVAVIDLNQPPPPHEDAEVKAQTELLSAEQEDTTGITRIPSREEAEPTLEGKEVAEREALIRAFADWKLTIRRVYGQHYLTARKEIGGSTVEKTVCPLDTETKRIIELLNLEVHEETLPVATTPEQAAPAEKHHPPAQETLTQPKRVQSGKAGREDLILKYARWGLRVKRVKGKEYLCAFKRVEGKVVESSLGRLDDEAKQIIEKLGLRVKGLNN